MEDFHVGPYMTAVGAGEMLTEIRLAAAPGRGQRAREGRAARRRLGDRRGVGGRLDRGRRDRRRRHRAQRGRADHDPPHPRRGAAARQGAVGGAVRAGGRDRVGGLLAERRRPRAGRLQAPPRRRAHPTRAAPRDGARAAPGGLTMNVTMTVNGEQVSRDVEPRLLLVHFIRETLGLTGTHWGCDTSNCGACVVLMDGQPVKSCTILAAMCDGPRDPHGRVARGRRRARPGPAGLPRAPRAPVRVLHAGDADDARARCWTRTRTRPTTRSAPRSRARSAAAPATRTSSAPSAGPPSTKPPRDRRPEHGHRREPSEPVDRAPDRLRPAEAQGGRALHPRPGHLPRRHQAAGHGPRRGPAQPVRARAHRLDRHLGRARASRTSPPSSPPRTSRRSASPGCRRSPTTRRPCSPATRSASRARRSRS